MFQGAIHIRPRTYVIAGTVLLLLLIGVFIYHGKNDVADLTLSSEGDLQTVAPLKKDATATGSNDAVAVNTAAPAAEDIVVDVKGAVTRPGVYTLKAGTRVNDAVLAAGGITAEADIALINLALKLSDGMAVVVPKLGETEVKVPLNQAGIAENQQGQVTGTYLMASTSGLVNLNTADTVQLETLPGIGPSKSSAILQYRTEHGSFKTVEELKEVSGIGDKTFEKLKPLITVQ